MAEERRPHFVHLDDESCLSKYSDGQSWTECDKSAELMLKKFQQEEDRIDRNERHLAELVEKNEASKEERNDAMP